MSRQNKKVVIFLVNSGVYSGAELVNLKIIKSLSWKYKFYYASEKGIIDTYFEKEGIQHIVIDKINAKNIRKIENTYQPDIFHATDFRVSVACALANLKVPFISHLHNNPLWIKKLHPYTFAYLFAARKAPIILTVSKSIEKEYIFADLISRKIYCISNPVCCGDVTRHKPQTQEKKFDICFTGRLSDQKNPLFYLSLVKQLHNKHPQLKAIMVGDGELRDIVRQYIQKNNMSGYVTLTGFQKNPYLWMDQSKIFLLPSKYEGFGLVFFEALTLGLPCVASDVGGISDIITEKCGFLCHSRAEYIKSLELLLEDENLYRTYSKEAQKRAQRMENLSEYMEKIDACYTKLLLEKS